MAALNERNAAPRQTRMRRTKLAAGSILAAMAGLYVFSRSFQETWPMLEWLRAFAEAGMVGGLADWFAVTALFRHPLGIPIPHTAVIPREKDRIGRALASFVRGNFLTSERICKQARDLQLIPRIAHWISGPVQAEKIARQTVGTMPAILDALENHQLHQRITDRAIKRLHTIEPHRISHKLLEWLLSENRYRQLLAPLLAQMAGALATNKERIDRAAGSKAPLGKVPLLGKISKIIAENISDRATENIELKLIAASQDSSAPLWDIIHEQILAMQDQLVTNPELISELENIRDSLLGNEPDGSTSPALTEYAERLWQQLRQRLDHDLSREAPISAAQLSTAIITLGQSIEKNPKLAANIEALLLDGISRILDQHGEHLETMIRHTVEEWDPDTLIQKLEQQIGPDLQFIRINGTLIGGLVGLALHATGKLFW